MKLLQRLQKEYLRSVKRKAPPRQRCSQTGGQRRSVQQYCQYMRAFQPTRFAKQQAIRRRLKPSHTLGRTIGRDST